jgi:hypothetical protein
MDADDLMHRGRLAAQVRTLEAAPDLAAVGAHVRVFPRARLTDGLRAYERWLNTIDSAARVRAEAFVECPIVHPTLMARAEILHALGYRECAWAEDYDLVLRMLAGGHEIGIVTRRLLGWRDGPQRLTRRDSRYAIERFAECKAAFLASSLLARSDDYILWGYGSTGRALRRALLAHGKRPRFVVELHPGRLGQRIHGAGVIPPEALLRVTRRPIIASVAGDVPRARIRGALTAMGFAELVDFVCTA